MATEPLRRKLSLISVVSLLYLFLIYTDPLWMRYPGGLWIPILFLLIVVGFFWLTFSLCIELLGLMKNKKDRTWRQMLPALLITLILCFSFFYTIPFDVEEEVYGKVLFRACYEGTQNQATLKLREGNRFEIHWTGVFFYDEYFVGRYSQSLDTLFLNYQGDKPARFGEIVYMESQSKLLRTIRQHGDSSANDVSFYYGYCQGLN
jgi:hypothetical protein